MNIFKSCNCITYKTKGSNANIESLRENASFILELLLAKFGMFKSFLYYFYCLVLKEFYNHKK